MIEKKIYKNFTKEEIQNLPLKYFDGDITVIDRIEQLQECISFLKVQPILGFDTETKPSFKKGRTNNNDVALLQLTTSDQAFLFRLNKIGLPENLADILADKNILKIGVAIKDDIHKLQILNDFNAGNFIDLRNYVKRFGIDNFGIKRLAAIILNVRISKSQQLSNWENEELSPAQQRYAAIDAWSCYEIYNVLNA